MAPKRKYKFNESCAMSLIVRQLCLTMAWRSVICVRRTFLYRVLVARMFAGTKSARTARHTKLAKSRVGVKYNWSSTQILQVLVIKYKYKYFAFSPIKYSSTSSTDIPSTSTSVNIGWLICMGNTRAVFPGKYRPVQ